MTKTKAIIKFGIIGLLVIIGMLLSFCKFRIPTTEYDFEGFYNAIHAKMGIDLNGGVLAVFDCEKEDGSTDFDREVEATKQKIEKLLTDKGYTEATITKQGIYPNYKIRIEVPGMEDSTEIFDAIGTPANIEFTEPTDAAPQSSDEYDASKVRITGKGIKSVTVIASQDSANVGKYDLRIEFTGEGTTEFAAMTANAGKYLAIWSNKKLIMSPRIESAITNGITVISSTGGYTREQADAFALQIEAGLYSVKLTASETSIIPATMGDGALLAGMLALLLGVILIFVLMWIIYGDFGLLSNLSLLVYSIILLFFLAVIDAVQLTLPGIAGIILSIGMSVDANVIIFGHIKQEFSSGKNLRASFEAGFNRSVKTILDANITTIIAAAVLYLLGTGAIKGFAITLFLGVAVSMFVSLILMRGYAKLYLVLNGENGKRCKLFRNEVKTDDGKFASATAKSTKRKLNLGGEI
ncbi:MAG: protein translocase subunit SecD [Christensenellaceae bacterium]|nr:protein translocase subunit SecD [Christensenellaceae bacterium]